MWLPLDIREAPRHEFDAALKEAGKERPDGEPGMMMTRAIEIFRKRRDEKLQDQRIDYAGAFIENME